MEFQEISSRPPWEATPAGPVGNNEDNGLKCQSVDDPDMGDRAPATEIASSKVTWTPTDHLRSLLSQGQDGEEAGNTRAEGVAQDLRDQDDELRALGISVVDQLSLERDVEAAVDQAVAKHTRKQRLQILKKEIKDIRLNVKQGDNRLSSLRSRLSGMRQRIVDPRKQMDLEQEIALKDLELKTLKAREAVLQQQLVLAEVNEEVLDEFELEEGEILDEDEEEGSNSTPKMPENEKARLIREGQMTPFGTAMTTSSSRTVSVLRPSHTPMEKSMAMAAVQKKLQKGPTKSEMISSGEMTPFGTVVKAAENIAPMSKGPADKPKTGMSDFEKYLQDQIDRQKQHSDGNKSSNRQRPAGDPMYGVPRKKNRKIKEFIGNVDYSGDANEESNEGTSLSSMKHQVKSSFEVKTTSNSGSPKKTNKKDPLKMHILHPKKKKKEKVSGSITSSKESDQLKLPPRRILSERVSLEGSNSEYSDADDGSGSEYVPSDQDNLILDEDDAWEDFGPDDTDISKRKSDCVEKLDKAVRARKKIEKDDCSDDDLPKTKGRKFSKSKDDGNLPDYVKRIENWKQERLIKKQEKILQGENLDSDEEEEEGYEEFEGGFRIPLIIWNKLYKYQRTCVKWLWELHGQRCGGILGDEMGLGKTIQIISFLVGLSYSRLSYRGQTWKGLGPVLVVCPATVLHQWVKELHKWWPPFRVALLHESGAFTGKRPALIHNINKYCGILITSYTGVRDQLETLLQYDWHYIILDEGHKIRNPEAQITVAMKRFRTPHRLILSGSPIQNSLKELWSLFDFVFPGKLGTLQVFLQQFAVPITQGGYANASKLEVQTAFKCASVLRDTINPYLLRRMKNDVRNHLSLPDKNEQVLFCGLTDEQRTVYREYIDGDQVKLIMGGRMKVFVGLINLRKICNHPDLYTGGPRPYDENWSSGLQPELKYGWWSRSGKMHVLHSVLRLWSRQGHRVLLFTQSRQMMCILEKFLLDEHYSYLKMDGTTTVASRQTLIDKFNSDSSCFVFLLTTRVGGLGVNLTGADRVIIFDPDWNPSTDTQARERAWRIGQLRHVTIYRLLTAGTIEEKIYHRQIFKQFLTNRVLKDPKQQRFFKTNDLYELFSLNEGDKEKTESSAIFAGTGSEITVTVKEKDEDTEKTESNSRSNRAEKIISKPCSDQQNQKSFVEKNPSSQSQYTKAQTEKEKRKLKKLKEESNKKDGQTSPLSDLSKIEKMRELARRLSQKIGSKGSSKEESTTVSTKQECVENESGNSGAVLSEVSLNVGNDENNKIATKKEELLEVKTDVQQVRTEKPESLDSGISEQCITSRLEDMKHEVESEETNTSNLSVVDKNGPFSNTNSSVDGSVTVECTKDRVVSENEPHKRTSSVDGSVTIECTKDRVVSENEPHQRRHKKKDKHRDREKHRKKGKKFEGERIDFLVKKRVYQKTEEEEERDKGNAKSQDQYVLEKLFQKSGVHTALSHDVIVSNGDPDYLLMEGEAQRVAKEALKAVRASRAQCFRPQLMDGASGDSAKSKHRFGNKKNKLFASTNGGENNVENEVKKKIKKRQMFDGGIDDDDEDDNTNNGKELFRSFKKSKSGTEGSSGVLSSSQLLSRMRQRNKVLTLDSGEEDEDYDPDYPSTVPAVTERIDPEVQENVDLLTDIRNFVAFQAEVDGRASTQELISRFKDRLPSEQTPFFKALLTQICDFHREVTGKGIWSLKGEFR